MDQIVKDRFVSLMKPIAADEEERSGIKPIITITQAAHESGWGMSGLTDKANNLFGFTGESWEAKGKPVIKMPTKEFVNNEWITVARPFRSYQSWAESVRDWGFLLQRERYAHALIAAVAGELPRFANEVYKAGYATDPGYPAALIGVGADVNAILEGELP